MNKLFSLYRYLIYRLKAGTLHGLHSPFVYELVEQVIYNKADYYCYRHIEALRETLLDSTDTATCKELGAGSHTNNKQTKRVKNIAANALKSTKYSQLIFRLVNYFQPLTSLEIGTSLGITTAYIASANQQNKVITLEGCEPVLNIAKQNFEKLELKNIEAHLGNFDDTLPNVLSKLEQLDFVFFDGNHRYEPTMRYFHLSKQKATENSLFVFDDIYWSKEMYKAWQEIKNDSDVIVTIDLYFIGLVFFRKKQVKQHFVIRL